MKEPTSVQMMNTKSHVDFHLWEKIYPHGYAFALSFQQDSIMLAKVCSLFLLLNRVCPKQKKKKKKKIEYLLRGL